MRKLSSGDVVQLKSGSPRMTVTVVFGEPTTPKQLEEIAQKRGYQSGDVSCEWFDGAAIKTGFFHASTLKESHPLP